MYDHFCICKRWERAQGNQWKREIGFVSENFFFFGKLLTNFFKSGGQTNRKLKFSGKVWFSINFRALRRKRTAHFCLQSFIVQAKQLNKIMFFPHNHCLFAKPHHWSNQSQLQQCSTRGRPSISARFILRPGDEHGHILCTSFRDLQPSSVPCAELLAT